MRYTIILISILIFTLCGCHQNDPDKLPEINLIETHSIVSDQEIDFITHLSFDANGAIWVGTFGSGIILIDGDKATNFNTENGSLPDDRVNDIFIDYENRVWVATDEGFSLYENGLWQMYDEGNTPLNNSRITEIAWNNNDELLIGTGNTSIGGLLFRKKSGQWIKLSNSNSSLPCNLIKDIEVSEDGTFWVSTAQFTGEGGIVSVKDGSIMEVLTAENSGLLYNHVDNIELSENGIWAGYEVFIFNESGIGDGGLQQIDPVGKTASNYFPNDTELVSNRISTMKLQSTGELWFTTSIDDPLCKNCLSGIGKINTHGELIAFSALNADMDENAFFSALAEDNDEHMYVASELTIYKLSIK